LVDISGDMDVIELGPSVAKRARQSPEPILMDENRLDLVTVEIEAKVNRFYLFLMFFLYYLCCNIFSLMLTFHLAILLFILFI
jgi:hypothetical protein